MKKHKNTSKKIHKKLKYLQFVTSKPSQYITLLTRDNLMFTNYLQEKEYSKTRKEPTSVNFTEE